MIFFYFFHKWGPDERGSSSDRQNSSRDDARYYFYYFTENGLQARGRLMMFQHLFAVLQRKTNHESDPEVSGSVRGASPT